MFLLLFVFQLNREIQAPLMPRVQKNGQLAAARIARVQKEAYLPQQAHPL